MKSLWVEITQNELNLKPLEKDEQTEVCVIGAGLFGLTTAYYLTQQGKKVTVVEKGEIGEKVSGNTITIIEGNNNEAVKRRNITVNARYIRGYGVPKYEAEVVAPVQPSTPAPATKSVSATESAKSFSNSIAGTYKSTANLNVRFGAGTTKKVMTTIPKGTQVKNYGYYTMVSNTKWLYIQFTLNGVKYTGFASSKYLKKA